MPKQELKRTKTQDQEYRARLLRLEQMGISIGSAGDPSPEPDRLVLEQIDHDFARLFELPSGAVAAVVPAKMKVLKSGILITDTEMTTSLDEFPLDLSDPEEYQSYQDVIAWLPYSKILNRFLTSPRPLRPCQVQGVIVANGWSRVPPKYRDETIIRMELLLRDERNNETCVKFGVRLDRSLQRKYERRQQERHAVLRSRSTKREGLFAREGGQLGDQKSVSTEEAVHPRDVSGERDGGIPKPN